jgi:hypothetical protein
MYARSSKRTLLSFLVDVHVNIGHILLFVVQMYVGRLLDVRSANSTLTYKETLNICYFLELPSG